VSAWISKQSNAPGKAPASPARPSLNLEHAIGHLLCQHGRLIERRGRHLMHFLASTRHADGSVDYLVRTRMHTVNGMERNFESYVRVSADHTLKLLR
jgi:hypothetical protein